jgi:uncharacterized SAM-binding protein YcdF (DUF218 family)
MGAVAMDPSPQPNRPRRNFLPVLLFLTIAILVVWFASVGWAIYSYAQRDETRQADVAIVLGAGTRGDRPSPVFRERIDHAIDLYRRGLVQAIILTGGVGQGRLVADSEIAREYALAEGVPDEVIYVETISETTLQNLQEAQQLMTDLGADTALVVSDPLHMYRAMGMAADLNMDAYASPTPTSRFNSWWSNLFFLVRETIVTTLYDLGFVSAESS